MANIHLPPTLIPLFAGLPRRLDLEAATLDDAISRLDTQWPGLRDRLCDPNHGHIRQHIHVYVDREQARLDTPLQPHSQIHVIAAITGG